MAKMALQTGQNQVNKRSGVQVFASEKGIGGLSVRSCLDLLQ